MRPDPEPGQPARIRNAGSGDQDNRHREQLRQDPLPEIGNQCGRIRVHYERGNNMTEKGYKQRIISNCKSIGTYRKEFDLVIDNLAYMYVRRDLTKEAYRQSGEELVVEQVNKNGSKYATRNPYLTELDNCNKIILELEKELGLTPLAKKKIDGGVFGDRQGESDPLTTALTQLRVVKG